MEMEKSKVLIKFLLNFRQSGDVLFFLNVRRLRGYTATLASLVFLIKHRYIQEGVKEICSLFYLLRKGATRIRKNAHVKPENILNK